MGGIPALLPFSDSFEIVFGSASRLAMLNQVLRPLALVFWILPPLSNGQLLNNHHASSTKIRSASIYLGSLALAAVALGIDGRFVSLTPRCRASAEEINDDDNWSPSTEFKIVLTHPQNCRWHVYGYRLHTLSSDHCSTCCCPSSCRAGDQQPSCPQ